MSQVHQTQTHNQNILISVNKGLAKYHIWVQIVEVCRFLVCHNVTFCDFIVQEQHSSNIC